MSKINWPLTWKAVVIIFLTAVMDVTVLVVSQSKNPFFILITVIVSIALSLAIVQMCWTIITKLVQRVRIRKTTPKIELKFILPEENDLRLRIHNTKSSKQIFLKCQNIDYLTLRGKKYTWEFPNELNIVRDSHCGSYPLYTGTLSPNDIVEVRIGFPHNGKISLRYLDDDSPVYGFRDGAWEYVVKCSGKYLNKSFSLPNSSIWLVIKNGVLVDIKDEL